MIRLFHRQHWHTWIKQYQHYLLWGGILLFTLLVGWALLNKYGAFGYDAIDLGIYTQVFHNSAQGNLFEFSIHPHLYLGDHFELFIIVLLPLYLLWQSPEMLLLLQTAFIALAAWPLWLIARRWLAPQWSLLIAGAYLLNPVILNMAFFEFHLLVFAIPLLLFAFYFYLEKNLTPFTIFTLLALTVREDVALVIIGFGLMAFFDKRPWRWVLTPLMVGGSWFAVAFNLTGYYNQSSGYKFIALYSWLGATQREIIINAITQPWRWLIQLLSFNNLILVAGLAVPVAGLYLLRLRYFIPVVFIILQLFLTKISATILLQTHYTALLLPFVFVAAAAGLHELTRHKLKRPTIEASILKYKAPATVILVMAVLYSFATFSPVSALLTPPPRLADGEHTALESMVATISPQSTVVSSFSTLPVLAQRANLYSLHYAFLGVRQFTDIPLTIPPTVDDVIIDYSDFVVYYIQSQAITSYVQQYDTGANRISALFTDNNLQIDSIYDSVVRYKRDAPAEVSLVETNVSSSSSARQLDVSPNQALALSAWEIATTPPQVQSSPLETLPLSLYWTVQEELERDYQLELSIRDTEGQLVHHKYYPLGYGTHPTSTWTPGDTIKTNYWFVIPPQYNNQAFSVSLQVVRLEGYMTLDAVRSIKTQITNQQPVGPAIVIGNESLDTVQPLN